MHPQLVGSSGSGHKFQSCDIPAFISFHSDLLPVCYRLPAVLPVCYLSWAMFRIQTHRKVYGSRIFCYNAFDQRFIFLADVSFFEIHRKCVMGIVCQTQNQESRCCLIQAVNAWLCNDMSKMMPDTARNTVEFFRSLSWNAEQPLGLVHYYYLIVQKYYIQSDDVLQYRLAS